MTCPPPAALHASIARLNAEVLSVEPLPFAPKLRASNVAAGIIGNAVSAPSAERERTGMATAPPATVRPVMSACRRVIRLAMVTPHGVLDGPAGGTGSACGPDVHDRVKAVKRVIRCLSARSRRHRAYWFVTPFRPTKSFAAPSSAETHSEGCHWMRRLDETPRLHLGGRMATTKTRRAWVKPEATQVRLGAEVTSYAGMDPLRP